MEGYANGAGGSGGQARTAAVAADVKISAGGAGGDAKRVGGRAGVAEGYGLRRAGSAHGRGSEVCLVSDNSGFVLNPAATRFSAPRTSFAPTSPTSF